MRVVFDRLILNDLTGRVVNTRTGTVHLQVTSHHRLTVCHIDGPAARELRRGSPSLNITCRNCRRILSRLAVQIAQALV